MSLSREEVLELANILNARAGHGRSEPPKLRLVVPPTPKLLDPIFRDAHIKRIVHLRDRYRLRWLVDQATFNVASLSCLEDCDLIRLLNDMERARECIADGIAFEDAGLVRSLLRDELFEKAVEKASIKQQEIASMGVDRMREKPALEYDVSREESPF